MAEVIKKNGKFELIEKAVKAEDTAKIAKVKDADIAALLQDLLKRVTALEER
jgi:hypothetical protein